MSGRLRSGGWAAVGWFTLAAVAIALAASARHISEANNLAWDRYRAYKDHMAECVPKHPARRCQELWEYIVPADRRRM